MKIIPNAVDVRKYQFNPQKRTMMRNKLGVEDKLVIGCVGRFRTEKNQAFLLGVLKEVLEFEPSAILLFAGDGPLENDVKQKAIEMGIDDKCVFLGMRSDIPNVMQAIDVLVLPSLFEGLPVTGIEAQASGLHCVVSDGITKEMNVIGLVEYISLDAPPDEWAKSIINCAKQKRRDTFDDIKAAGYDIHTTASWLQEFYLRNAYIER